MSGAKESYEQVFPLLGFSAGDLWVYSYHPAVLT